jgi:DinB superfamily
MPRFLTAILAIAAVTQVFASGQERPPQSKTVPDSINLIWKNVAKDFTALAQAMPEDKWSFKPTQGAFTNARTFGEQVKHVACANEAWATQMMKQKQPERCDLGGPSPAKSKADILAYLRESFAQMDQAIASLNVNNLVEPVNGEYWGDNRLSAVTAAVWHISDHYGQLVEYLRMNGLVPPASQ